MSDQELEKLTRRYTSEIMDIIGPERDVPARTSTPMSGSWPG